MTMEYTNALLEGKYKNKTKKEKNKNYHLYRDEGANLTAECWRDFNRWICLPLETANLQFPRDLIPTDQEDVERMKVLAQKVHKRIGQTVDPLVRHR